MGERTRYEPGTFCWVGLATSDPAAATAFYTSLFGWEADELPAGEAGTFTILRQGGNDVAILYRQQPQARAAGAPPHWTSYISVEDADATAARASELGGAAVFRAPFDVLDAGRVAAIRDPTYVSIKSAGSLNGGMREQTMKERGVPPSWLPYFTVKNAEDAAREAAQLGGTELVSTTEIHTGRFAVISDPQGAAFAIFEGETAP
jgi:predicted enzyme related to lactoylglutathione lyase